MYHVSVDFGAILDIFMSLDTKLQVATAATTKQYRTLWTRRLIRINICLLSCSIQTLHEYHNFVLFVCCPLFNLYSILTANVKLNINQRCVTLLKTIAISYATAQSVHTHDGNNGILMLSCSAWWSLVSAN